MLGSRDTLIQTAKLNDIDPQTWLADILARLADHPAKQIADLLPWIGARTSSSPSPRSSACGLHRMRTLADRRRQVLTTGIGFEPVSRAHCC